ncbi:hypothetical protein LJY25_05720 [Hymenobacter sp. BT175]|uniref:hypothetical protein n=1 Tax=Hymenobacter translucens TaxID=2886507 RepID=UPI001D0ED0F3|nr:hypothetical protein [Hymenobacter translucens]MCC2545934.1 hypothetical protein [Hymenobacter translucens]
METPFSLNITPAYAEALFQQHGREQGHNAIADLEDAIGAAIYRLQQQHDMLPGTGDRLYVEDELIVVVQTRSFEADGTVWFAIGPFVAPTA